MKSRQHKVIALIPARYASTRFPGKPLALIQGKSLIQRTYENAKRCSLLEDLIVATDDARIYDHILEFGGKAVMTPADLPTGSDRLAYVVKHDPNLQKAQVIVNIQGDDPCLDPKVTASIIELLREDPTASMSTAATPIDALEEAMDHNSVKCVFDLNGNALYFSRVLIPSGHSPSFRKNIHYYKHIGIYAFRPDFLLKYITLPLSPLQRAEDLEQLKALEHGYKIKVAVVPHDSPGVNTPEDIKKVEQVLCKQNLYSSQEGCAHP